MASFATSFDRDAFHSLRTKTASASTAELLSAVQHRPVEEIVAGLACAFLLVTDRYRVQPQDAFSATRQMIRHHDERGKSDFDGLRSYLDADVFGTQANFSPEEIQSR